METVVIANLKLHKPGVDRILTFSALMASKAGLIGLALALSAGAAAMGRSLAPDYARYKSRAGLPQKAQEKTHDEVNPSNLRSGPMAKDSLGYLSGSLDGKTPEQRARDQAEVQSRRDANVFPNGTAHGGPGGLDARRDANVFPNGAAHGGPGGLDARRNADVSPDGVAHGGPGGLDAGLYSRRALSVKQLEAASQYSRYGAGSFKDEAGRDLAAQSFDSAAKAGAAAEGQGVPVGNQVVGSPRGSPASNPVLGSAAPVYGRNCVHGLDTDTGLCAAGPGASKDPTDPITKTIKVLMAGASAVVFFAVFAWLCAKASVLPQVPAAFTALAKVLGFALNLCAAGILTLGVVLASMGRPVLGAACAAAGAVALFQSQIGNFLGFNPILTVFLAAIINGVMPMLGGNKWDKRYNDKYN